MKTIKLMADYQCHPLWHDSMDEFGDIDPQDLPLSSELRARLAQWARDYDQTLNLDAPQDSGFKSEALEAEFTAEGHRLASCLREELGAGYVITEFI
ncbi:hypothetical protein ACI2KS_26905 [Pseudomonas sp. NPDC087358]|uniref:hypothetical protein n=1 Tax=Pseudomonas sp. NPDC087358 TaxID=3364439 RepID=UPI00384EB52E